MRSAEGGATEASVLETLVSERLLLVREIEGAPVYGSRTRPGQRLAAAARVAEQRRRAARRARAPDHRRVGMAARLGKTRDALWNERQLQEVDSSGLDLATLSQRESDS